MTDLSRKLTRNGVYYQPHMMRTPKHDSFAALFKKYRLRSEIESLSEFGDLLAEEGMVYETSLFTRWQNGERVPRDRKILMAILKVYIKSGGINNYHEANALLESSYQGYLTQVEKESFNTILKPSLLNKSSEGIGNKIRNYRIKKNKSQLELSLLLGWKDSHHIDHIEEDLGEKPIRSTVDKICKVLQLTEQEKNNLLLAGNYLPTKEELDNVQKQVFPLIENWPYPSSILDFSWRIIAENSKSKVLLYNFEHKLEGNNPFPHIIEHVYNPDFLMNKQSNELLKRWREWQYEVLVHFKEAHKNRTKEVWYQDLIKRLLKYRPFKENWQKVQMENKTPIFSNLGTKFFPHPKKKNKILQFHFFVIPLYGDPRFEIEFYNPADIETFKFYHEK